MKTRVPTCAGQDLHLCSVAVLFRLRCQHDQSNTTVVVVRVVTVTTSTMRTTTVLT